MWTEMLKDTALNRIFEPKRDEVMGDWEKTG
jgi:hypothetical protein